MTFSGFPKDTLRFLSGLKKNNDRSWFEAHREQYEASFVEPAKAFVEAIAPRLHKIDPGVRAEARVNGSILRLNRDIRFSKDKTPYKNHMDLWFWCGADKGWDTPGFYFRLTSDALMLGTGMHVFTSAGLKLYRAAVLDPKKGAALEKLVGKMRKAGYEVGSESFKKTPKGVPADHPRATLLKYGGLHAGWEGKPPRELHSAGFVDLVAKHFTAVAPVHAWLKAM